MRGVKRKRRSLVRTLRVCWYKASALERIATSYKAASALPLLHAMGQFCGTSGDAHRGAYLDGRFKHK